MGGGNVKKEKRKKRGDPLRIGSVRGHDYIGGPSKSQSSGYTTCTVLGGRFVVRNRSPFPEK